MGIKYYQQDKECMPLEELRKLQGERLAANFRHVYENVEYYRKRCQEAGVTPDDVKAVCKEVYAHRIEPFANSRNVSVYDIIDNALNSVTVPTEDFGRR